MKTSRTFMDMRLFRKRVAEGKPPENALLRKAAKIGLRPQEERTFGFVFSDGSVDRHGDTVSPKGWDVSHFSKNGPLLWAHQYDTPPLGRVSSLSKGSDLRGVVEFTPQGMSNFNDMIFNMVKGGFLSATSVGFAPKAYDFNDDRGGFDFTEQELLEVSVVPVPANPNALIEARSAGIDLTEMEQWVNESMFWLEDQDSVLVPRHNLEMAADALGIKMSVWSAPEEVWIKEVAVPDEEIVEEIAKEVEVVEEISEVDVLKNELAEMRAVLGMRDEPEDDGFVIEMSDTAPEAVADISDSELRDTVSQTLREVFAPTKAEFTKVTGRIID